MIYALGVSLGGMILFFVFWMDERRRSSTLEVRLGRMVDELERERTSRKALMLALADTARRAHPPVASGGASDTSLPWPEVLDL
jgi:hypothetical protein